MPRRPEQRSLGRNRRGIAPLLLVLIIVVVAVVVVVGGLYAAGVFTSKSSSSAKTYTVTFVESGLTGSYTWRVVLGGTSHSSTTSTITFSEPNGTSYAFTVAAVTSYSASPSSGTITVSGANVAQAITFTKQATYSVEFTESGLPPGTSWSVTLNGGTMSSTTSTITFTEANGTSSFSVSATGYTANPASGSIVVNGADLTEPIAFTAVPPGVYTVTFTETGLASGTSWLVTLNNVTISSSTSTITFTEANRTYFFTVYAAGYTASPSSGWLTVSGAAASQAITFTPTTETTYTLTFTETGLPSGTSWSVTLQGAISNSTTSTITFTVTNGSYVYNIGSVSGYTTTYPPAGSVTVAGQAQTIQVTFTRSSSGGQSSYSQALPIATSAASSQGTGWALIFAGGFDLTSSPTVNSTPFGNSTCRLAGGTGTLPGIVTWTGAYSNGLLSQWLFEFYRNASSTPSLLYVWVSGGSATVVGTISGSGCEPTFGGVQGIETNIMDSSAVASAIASNDSAYVRAWPQASAAFFLTGGYHAGSFSSGSLWVILFTTCPPNGNGAGTGYNYTADANATTGALVYSTTTSGRCGANGLSPAAPSPLQFGMAAPRLSLDPSFVQGNTGLMQPARTTVPAQRPAVPTGARAAR